MANNCSLKFNETKVYTNLKAEVGNDDVLFNSLMSAVIDGSRPSGFNKEFETYYANNYGSIPNTNDESKEVATAIQNFYKNRNFNVNEHTTGSAFISDVKSKGYTSTAAKTCGIRTTGNLMLAFYHNDLIKGRLEEHAEDRKDNLANRVINRMLGAVATNILEARKVEATKEEIAKVRKQLMNTKSNDFIKLEDEVSKTTPQLRNQFATLKDMLSDKVKYFTQVIQTDDRLGEIRFKKDDDLSQQEADWSESFDIEDDDDLNINNAADNASNNEKDTTTARWEDNGTKSDFMKDFSFAVRSYLSTIPKLSSTEVSADGKYQYDKSNPLGMVDYMDFKVVNSAIRGDIETTNIDAFLKKLEDIAESNKEYAGLAYLANDLKKKPDFAYKLFQVYRRRTIRKQQVRIDDTSVSPTRSNNRADKLETLRINYLNDIKSTALNIMIEDTNDILGAIKTKIDDYKTLQKTKRFDLNKEALSADIINAIASRLKQYYPSLDKAAIERFARLNGKVDGKAPNIANNLTQLYGYLENTAKYANETLNNKRNLDNRFKEANKIKDKKAKKEALDSVREAYKQGYLSTNTKAYALELAKSLAPYSVVNIDSNSTNALGNQSADQINDSMITNFLNAVKATLTEQQKDGSKVSTELINYGKYKFQGVQYNLSGILMEHRDENGAVINYGLFYKDKDGNIQITNYARDMVNISLFDGAGNPNTKDNVLYSGMSKGDYVYTGFAQYFNAEQNPKMLMGDYFMRIPSDAPKNFVVHAPRYKVDGLFSKMHAIKNAKGEVIAKEVSVDDINENHPIVQQFRNIFKQELLDMVNFINIVFEVKENTETLEDGTVVDQRGRIVFNNDNTPMFKKGWGLDAESARRVFANYHIGKGHKHFIEKKGDGWAFNGLLFKDDRFVLTDYKTGKTTKYGDKLLEYMFPSLYGGARDGFIPFTTNANGEVELNLSVDQEAMITRMVKGFVTDYSNNAISRMSEYKDFDINNLINEKNSIDFALNHRLMYIAFNDIFEGDTKFYKDTQTFLKRSKESQASGVPYGFVDTSLDLRENSTIVQGAFLNTPEVQTRLKAIGLDVQQKTKFNGITIKNTVRTSEECKVAKTYPDGKVEGEDGILVKDLVKNAKLTLDQARDLMGGPIMYDNNGKPKLNNDGSYRRSGGFSNTTINDAQSYITFEEWIRRIAGRGQLNDYLPLIEAIQDESKDIPADLLKKFVQVQKNFYYDQYYDEKLNTIAPRQIKNAEFVLVPRFIKGTQLEQVYEAMKANKIDQLNTEETSKAGKARVLTIFDEKTGEVTEEHLKDFNNKAEDYREEYDYNHLYTQQETPQHMNAKNKAGIQIMKKILDNIDSNSPLHAYKEDFFNMYVANIKDSFNKLVDELKIPLDEDGNIKFDEAGNITGVDMQVFFDKLKDECMRLGLDSNMMDFVTLNASMPIAANGCPNPVMPTYLSNVVNKLESISQAMFNSAITRQELPGFHAAQITNVGFKATKDQVSYSKELKYHPNGERYIEIMLPASNFGFAKNADGTYKKSKEELLKELQDAGLDTLIGYRIPTEGKQSVCVMKVVGFLDDAQGSTIVVPDDWVSQTGSDFDIDSVYGIQYNTYIDKHGNIRKQDYSEKLDIYDYANYVNRHLEKADKIKDKSVKEAFEKLNKEIDEQFEKSRKELVEEETQAYDVLSDETKEILQARIDKFNKAAKKLGIMSYKQYLAQNVEDANTREARNNRLLDDMIHILQANEALEENLSRSNFESIIAARDKVMNSIVKEVREARSPYDFLDQAAYQEDVMSGAKLKAFSVTRDTFCSVCNTVHPHITDKYTIKVAYSKDKYNLEELQKRFEKVEETDEGYVVTHNTLGWTNDNKNVDGYILTAYSSQTTAHILDAVKEGAIPNVNDFTFAVYKTLADIGSNYDTAVGFIMQPAITRIVNAYNANKSIYSDKHNKPIEEAIRSLGKEVLNAYHINTDKINLGEIIARVNGLLGTKYSLDKHNDITLSPDELAKRLLNDKNRPVKGSIYQHDWAVLFAYNDLAKLSDKIGATARVCNPDRFGAKQSIFATRKVFNDIADLIEDENPALVVGTSSIVNSIYAGYDPTKGLRSYITSNAKSAYPSLNAFLKYASAPSILVNRMLFDTEQDNFRIANRAIEVINGSNNVTEKDYKGFTQYILNAAYKQTDAVVNNYTYDVEKKQTVVNKEFDETDEALRIMGYGCTPDFTFNVKNVTNPTQEEVNAWSKLSPAQKISWLKANSVDAGIFNYINTNLFNEYEMNRDGQSRQTIRFNEDAVDNETAYNLFDTAFSSDNPLVKLAAMDMVKYAFVAEGFKIGRGAINKCIKNTALRDENTFVQYNGSRTSIIAQIKAQVDNAVARTDLVEQYFRTDPGVTNVPHKFMSKKYSSMFKTVTREMYEFGLDDKDNAIEFGFARESNAKFVPIQFNNYIYITKKEGNESVTRLYKIVSPDLGSGIGFAYPLNGLEAGEDREVSINNANNSVPLPSYYEAVIDNLMNSEIADYTLDELNELYKKHVATTKINKVKAVTHFDIMSDANNDNGGAKDAIDKIIKTFNDYEGNRIFIQNMYLYGKTKYDLFTPPIHVEGETISNGGEPISINGNFLFRRATKVSIESHNIRTGEHIEEKPQLVEIVRETPMASSREEVTLGSASSKLEQSLRTTTDSFEKNIVKELNRRSGLGDIEAGKLMRQLRGEGFEQSTKGYKEFKDSVFYSGYAYLKHKVNSTLGKFSQFYRDENGNYFAINSPEVINVIKNNPALQRQFLETLADANVIVDKFGIINQIKADEIENPTLKFYIDEMQKMIKELSNSSIIDDAEVKFGLDYLQKLSNDPNIQNGLISIYDGFHSSGWLDAWFGDLQEQGNSLVQVVTRKVMADIRAKESQAKDFAVAFGKHFEDIKARAAKVGASVDLNKIFDKNGNIVRNYTDKFVEDIKELKRNVAKARVNVQDNPMEYIQAKHKLDKFLLDHVNREYVDSYYQKLYDEDEFIINNHPQIYSEYIKLREAIRQINSRRIDGVLSKEFEDKLVELRTKINDLTSQFIGNEYKPTYEYGFPGTERAPDDSIIVTNQEVYDNARKQSLNDAVQLDQYLRRIKDIKEEYTAKEEKEGFRDMLDKMLNIIDNAEVRDANGKVTTPASQLDTNKEYKKAKEWIANNAHWSVDDVLKVRIEDAYKKLGITNFKASKARAFIKDKLAKGEQIYDEFGNIDASKFTNTEIAAIKEDVERNYGTTNTSLFSDRNLINSAEPTNEAAPSEFFKMLNSGGMTNPEYQEIITKINNITRKYYNSAAKIVETSKMSIEDLKALGDLYDELDKTKKHKGKGSYDAYQAYSKYAKENVNEQAYYSEEDEAKKRTEPEFYTLWKRVNARYEVLRDKKGKIVIDETTGKAVYDLTKAPTPNHWLYTTIAPNDAYWEDLNKRDPKEAARQKKEVEDKTKAQEFLSNTLETINTPQYYKAKNAALAKGIAYYKEWYDNNHVYNPFTHAYEALPIWNRTRVIPSIDNGEYSPNWTQTTLTPKAHYKNPNYIEGYTDNENYKTVETDDKNGTTHVPGYDNNLGLNEYEQEAKQYIQDTLMSFAKTETAKRAIASGMAPHRAKKAEHDAKWAAKQAKEFIGFSDMLPSGKDSWYEKIDYSEDRTIDMPMLMTQLKNKESVDLNNIRSTKPKRETYASDEAYEKDLEAYQKRIDEAIKKNEEIHQKLLDRDYIGAIQDFISAAGHYNAIQDNKQLLFYTHRMLGKMKAYDTNLGWNNLRKDSQTSTSDETSYIEKADTRLQEQFDNWVRRLVYDQYKIPQNKLTRTASMLQSFTSAKFMMLNITGGIGNITVGESAIAGEYIAKEYFTPTSWLKGKNMWRHAIPSFIRGMANEDSTTLADALVKFMNIVDFDEVNNRPTVHLDADTVLNKIRDFMYSPNSMGEHFMQNGTMFSMFFDNRMVKVPDAESNGRLGYEAMTWEQYKNKFHEYAMRNIIGGNEELINKYETFKKDILADDNKKKEYIWNRRDINTEFANLYLTKEQKKQFITERKKFEKEAKVKFEELPTVMDQVDLKDGRLAFKEGSILAELQAKSKDKEVGDGYMFLGYMKGKVISVNKKIHGVYDKLGAAQLEKQWWGSLAMQYHKHIYPGVMKHYRRKGYFNEERGTKEIGCAPALFDFLTTPIRKLRYEKEMSDGQVEVLESLQVLLKGYAEFAMNLQTNWQLMPKWQRASIERAASDVVGALGGICTALAVRCIWDDDDLKNSLWGNLMLYEADELTTQSMMYNMLFLPQQFDQLWSSPIAGVTAGKDIMAACNNIAAYVMDDDYDPNYTSGRYAGQNKIIVKLGRQIPIYRSLNNLATLDKANSYYKTGDNLLTLINIKNWANDIRGTSSLER
jgi:hypothetical protein